MAKRKGLTVTDDDSLLHFDPYLGLGEKGYEKAISTPSKTSDMRSQITMAQKAGAQGNSNSTAMNATAKAGFHYGNG